LGLRASSLAACLLVLSCAYSFRGNLPEHIKTVRITPVRNTASEYGLEQQLTSDLVEGVVNDGRLAVVNSSPDALVDCTITQFLRSPYSYSSAEVVEEYKLEMRVQLSFTDLVRDEAMISDEAVSRWIVYDPTVEDYSSAKTRLLTDMAEEIVRRCLSGW
jgi:outer membrane lipopolysaccharide assembly protein LptE/RlpB